MTRMLTSCAGCALRAVSSPLGLLAACKFALIAILLLAYASWRSVNSDDVDTEIFVQSGRAPEIAVLDVHFLSRWGSRVESRVVLPRERLRIQQRAHPGYEVSLRSDRDVSPWHWGVAVEYDFRSESVTDIGERRDRWISFAPDPAYTEVLTLSGPLPLLRATSHSTISSLAATNPAFGVDDGFIVNNYRPPDRFFRLSSFVVPTRILWPGFVASLATWILVFLLGHVVVRFVFLFHRLASGRCPVCRYETCSLTRTMSRLVCTECGFET
ncbi:MAG: hypothetical protein AAGD00_06485 [Planctomycetota bacterium]